MRVLLLLSPVVTELASTPLVSANPDDSSPSFAMVAEYDAVTQINGTLWAQIDVDFSNLPVFLIKRQFLGRVADGLSDAL